MKVNLFEVAADVSRLKLNGAGRGMSRLTFAATMGCYG
jgi:hypothetical protein